MPCIKGFTEIKRHRPTGQQPGSKSTYRPGDKPRINRSSSVDFFLHSFHMGFCLLVLLGRRSGDVSSMPWRVRGTLVVSWANNSVGTKSYPTPPRRPPGAPTRTASDMSGFWIRQALQPLGCFFSNMNELAVPKAKNERQERLQTFVHHYSLDEIAGTQKYTCRKLLVILSWTPKIDFTGLCLCKDIHA